MQDTTPLMLPGCRDDRPPLAPGQASQPKSPPTTPRVGQGQDQKLGLGLDGATEEEEETELNLRLEMESAEETGDCVDHDSWRQRCQPSLGTPPSGLVLCTTPFGVF